MSTLCHEFMHHLDVTSLGFQNSFHTIGFYERTHRLYLLPWAIPTILLSGAGLALKAGRSLTGRRQSDTGLKSWGESLGAKESEEGLVAAGSDQRKPLIRR